MAKIYESGEDYLEMIHMLHLKQNFVRAVDIAHSLDVSKPSVSRAMGILRDGGFIHVGDDGNITLTDEGRYIAESIYERHRVLTQWLIDIGVSPASWSTISARSPSTASKSISAMHIRRSRSKNKLHNRM